MAHVAEAEPRREGGRRMWVYFVFAAAALIAVEALKVYFERGGSFGGYAGPGELGTPHEGAECSHVGCGKLAVISVGSWGLCEEHFQEYLSSKD